MMGSIRNDLRRPAAGAVRIEDAFWSGYLGKIYRKTLPYTLDKLEGDGFLNNFALVAGAGQGEYRGPHFADGLLLESIRGACDLMAAEYDPALDERLDRMIAIIAAASDASPDGFLCTPTMLRYPDKRFGENGGDLVIQHDLYDQGALVEAAVSHYLATGKTTLLRPAVRAANYIARTIPDKGIVPGHSLPEEAFVRLYCLFRDHAELTAFAQAQDVNKEEYLALAEFWYDGRGKKPGSDRFSFGYHQNHLPFRQQMTAEGHSVRAALCYMGACAVAREAGREDFACPIEAIWRNIVDHKLHISGGIGTRHDIEGFDVDDNLPNNAYLETCAAIGLAFFAGELNLIRPGAERFDVFERALYNNILAAIGEDGRHFFYQNPLVSGGGVQRWAWNGCPCCPPMLLKLYGSLSSYIYMEGTDEVYVNLMIGSSYETEKYAIAQKDQVISFNSKGAEMTLRVRIPWYAEDFRLTLGGADVEYAVENGYACLRRAFNGEELTVSMKAEPVRVCAHPRVGADRGMAAVMHGAHLMCAEAIDNGGSVDFALAEEPELRMDGDCVIGKRADGGLFRLIPYYRWAGREGAGAMRVWFEQEGMKSEQKIEKALCGALYGNYEKI